MSNSVLLNTSDETIDKPMLGVDNKDDIPEKIETLFDLLTIDGNALKLFKFIFSFQFLLYIFFSPFIIFFNFFNGSNFQNKFINGFAVCSYNVKCRQKLNAENNDTYKNKYAQPFPGIDYNSLQDLLDGCVTIC